MSSCDATALANMSYLRAGYICLRRSLLKNRAPLQSHEGSVEVVPDDDVINLSLYAHSRSH